MASRSVVATVSVDGVEGVVAKFTKAGRAAEQYGKTVAGAGAAMSTWVDKHSRRLDAIGSSMLKLGAVGVAAFGLLGKAAVDWQTAWAGVTKTVDGAPDQMNELQDALRGLAKELPSTHEEIAAVAEAAGQLGVERENVADFTKTMINLGETTNLSAGDAATTLKRFANVMGTSTSDMDRVGSTLVDLGNSFATTEAEIAAMAQRVAGVGRQLGMTESDVLGFSAALSSVGIDAEAGGTAISTVMKRIDAAVRDGGSALQQWARVSGMSAQEFTKAWKGDTAKTMASIVEGFGKMASSGESVAGALAELGVKGIRESDAMNRLALATKSAGGETDLLREAVEKAGDAWEENVALQNEAAKRYETTESKVRMTLNALKDEAITLGNYLLPAIESVISVVTDMAGAFGQMPSGLREFVIGLGGVTTASLLAVGAFTTVVTGIAELRAGLQARGISAKTATLAMGAIGVALTAAGALFGHFAGKQLDAKQKLDDYTNAIRDQGKVISKTTRDMANQSMQDKGLLQWAKDAGVNLKDLSDAALGSESALKRVNAQMDEHVAALERQEAANQAVIDSMMGRELSEQERVRLTELTQKNEELSARISERVALNRDIQHALSEEIAVVREATDAGLLMAEARGEEVGASAEAAAAAEENAEKQRAVADEYAKTKEEIDALIDATFAYADAMLALSGSEIAVEDAIADLSKATAENGRTLNLQTEEGRKNQRALDDLARAGRSYIETLAKQGESTEGIIERTQRAKQVWIDNATAMGLSRQEAKLLADEYFAIPNVSPTVDATSAVEARRKVEELKQEIETLPQEKRTKILALLEQGKVAEVEAELKKLGRDRTVKMKIAPELKSIPSSLLPGLSVKQVHPNKEGAVVDYYARGGLREQHVAQIAPAGAWRVWAEPETGGEAYIPLATSKRTRSLEIWRETGRRLGVQGYRNGAVVAPATQQKAASSGVTIHAPITVTEAENADAVSRKIAARLGALL